MPSAISQVAGEMNSETHNVSQVRHMELRLDGVGIEKTALSGGYGIKKAVYVEVCIP